MARMRYVKPETWTDSNIIRLSPFARLLFIGSWNFTLCDRGHLPDDPLQLKLQILPADNVDAADLVDELLALRRLVRVEGADGKSYLQVLHLERHQKVDKRWSPRCPACGTEPAETQPSTPEPSGPLQTSAEPSGSPQNSPELPETRPNSAQEGRGGDRRGEKKTTSSSRSRGSRGTRIPDDFTVTPEMVSWARERVPHVNGRTETEKFVNYWRAKSGQGARKVDWVATWRNWMLNAAERAPARASPSSGMHPTDEGVAQLLSTPLRAISGGESA